MAELQHLTIHGKPALVAFLRGMGGPLVEAGDATLAIAQFEDGTHRYFTVAEPKTLGGSGSGNFGHAGRPGEVGGSSDEGIVAQAVRAKIPAAAHAQVGHITVHTEKTQTATTEKIDEWLMNHYGYDSAGQAKALADSYRGVIIAKDDEREVTEQWAHLFRPQIDSEEWRDATSHVPLPAREKSFTSAFADLILSKPGQELLDLANPLGFAMNKLADKFGWTRSEH